MIDLRKKKPDIPSEALFRLIWVSSFLAMIFSIPPLGIFLGFYYTTGDVILGAVLGFGIHFVTLAFAGKISKFLSNVIS